MRRVADYDLGRRPWLWRAAACHAHGTQSQRFDQGRTSTHFVGAELASDAPPLHHCDAIGDIEHKVEILLDDDDSEPGLGFEPREDLPDFLHYGWLHTFG